MSSSEEDSNDESTDHMLSAADRLLEVAEHGTTSSQGFFDSGGAEVVGGPSPKFRSLEERLLELHIEESAKAVANGAGAPAGLSNGLSSQQQLHHLQRIRTF